MNRLMIRNCTRLFCRGSTNRFVIKGSLHWRLRYSTDSTLKSSNPAKSFKAFSFREPKEDLNNSSINTTAVPGDDFKTTKLEHGKTDLKIAISKKAFDKLTSIEREDKNPNSALKISVESGGCHGFQYNLELTDLQKELDKDNNILVFSRDGDDGRKAHIILDDSSLEILQDSRIDYVKELIGSQFKVVDSPYTSTACGCGASFDFDFDKLEENKRAKAKSEEH